jgi:hypothetical protein
LNPQLRLYESIPGDPPESTTIRDRTGKLGKAGLLGSVQPHGKEQSVDFRGGENTEDVLAGWTHDVADEKPDFVGSVRDPYYILEPGYALVREDGNERLTITVRNETRTVDGVA